MMLIPKDQNEKVIYQKSRARQVYDVSGAGDTVAAIMTLALASKLSFEKAITLANCAAGKVIAKWGTQAITKKSEKY